MAQRHNHYEAAFEGYLRDRRIPYVAVDEARRSPLAQASLKSLDFIVSPTGMVGAGPWSWLIDVKGRRFPSGRQKRYWKNWLTRDDLRSMAQWEALFGPRFGGLFVFAYNIIGDRAPLPVEALFDHRGRTYAFVAIRLADYARLWRPLSARWDTVAIRSRWFRAAARPFDAFLAPDVDGLDLPLVASEGPLELDDDASACPLEQTI